MPFRACSLLKSCEKNRNHCTGNLHPGGRQMPPLFSYAFVEYIRYIANKNAICKAAAYMQIYEGL